MMCLSLQFEMQMILPSQNLNSSGGSKQPSITLQRISYTDITAELNVALEQNACKCTQPR